MKLREDKSIGQMTEVADLIDLFKNQKKQK
jgi:hypothetical protein